MKTIWGSTDKLEQKRSQCFVIMPFSEKWSERIWNKHIQKIITDFGMTCIRADQTYGRDIIQDTWRSIYESRVVLAEISNQNPNVLYELGIAHAFGKDTIILAQNEKDIPFNLRGFHIIIYEDNSDGYEKLEKEIPNFLKQYLFEKLVDNFGDKIKEDEFVLLYVSTGGTCRCTMSNVITRYYLGKDVEAHTFSRLNQQTSA